MSAKVEGYAVTVTYTVPFSYPKTMKEAKASATRCRILYPGDSIYKGAIWRLYEDGTRKLVKKGGEAED